MKLANIDKVKSSYLSNDLRNFSESFSKDVSYDNSKSHKTSIFIPSLENTVLEKPQGGQIDPPSLFIRLNFCVFIRKGIIRKHCTCENKTYTCLLNA